MSFASQQSDFANKTLNKRMIDFRIDAIIFVKSDKIYIKSSAIIRIIGELGYPWKFGLILFIVPTFLRNIVYDWIARKRYLWFGKKEICYISNTAYKDRFYD